MSQSTGLPDYAIFLDGIDKFLRDLTVEDFAKPETADELLQQCAPLPEIMISLAEKQDHEALSVIKNFFGGWLMEVESGKHEQDAYEQDAYKTPNAKIANSNFAPLLPMESALDKILDTIEAYEGMAAQPGQNMGDPASDPLQVPEELSGTLYGNPNKPNREV